MDEHMDVPDGLGGETAGAVAPPRDQQLLIEGGKVAGGELL
jgi:hypothetical protein